VQAGPRLIPDDLQQSEEGICANNEGDMLRAVHIFNALVGEANCFFKNILFLPEIRIDKTYIVPVDCDSQKNGLKSKESGRFTSMPIVLVHVDFLSAAGRTT
jgi:hypothetical protein